MPLLNFACSLESFRISHAGHGTYGDEIRFEGWLVAHPVPARLDLVFGGDTPAAYEIHSRDRESNGVHDHFGGTFGEAARSCRFLLVEKLPPTLPDWNRAALRIPGDDGTVVEVKLDPPENLELLAQGGQAESDLVMRFESCGDNCEFGLLQRKIGVERMALLRYAGVADVFALADAIENRFEGFAEGEALHIHTFGAEWMAAVPAQRMNFHTGRIIADISEERIRTEERRKLQFLAQKFVDDIEDGVKIFVYRTLRDGRGGPDGMKGMDRLYDAMRAIGPARLLWVNEADAAHPPATVRQVRDGLFHGFVERLAPHHDAFATDPEGWVKLLTEAAALIDDTTAPAAALSAAMA